MQQYGHPNRCMESTTSRHRPMLITVHTITGQFDSVGTERRQAVCAQCMCIIQQLSSAVATPWFVPNQFVIQESP